MVSRPYVIVNVAQSLNGLISGASGRRVSISSPEDRERVQMLRAGVDAILVGANTINCDNPALLVDRNLTGSSAKPLRVVLDGNLRISRDSRVLDDSVHTIIYSTVSEENLGSAEIRTRSRAELSVESVIAELYEGGVRRVLVEGGSQVIAQFIESNCVDEFHIYVGNLIIENGGTTLFNSEFEIRDIVKDIRPLGRGVLISLDPYHLQRSWRTQVKDI